MEKAAESPMCCNVQCVIMCAERRKTVHFCNWRDNSLGGVRKCSAVVVLVEVSLTRKRVHARMIVSSVNIVFENPRGAQVGYTRALQYSI